MKNLNDLHNEFVKKQIEKTSILDKAYLDYIRSRYPKEYNIAKKNINNPEYIVDFLKKHDDLYKFMEKFRLSLKEEINENKGRFEWTLSYWNYHDFLKDFTVK